MIVDTYLAFPDRETALIEMTALLPREAVVLPVEPFPEPEPGPVTKAVKKARKGRAVDVEPAPAPVLASFPTDGWYLSSRYDVVDVGPVWVEVARDDEDEEAGAPEMRQLQGYHLIVRMRGPDPLPENLQAFQTDPWGQVIG